VESNQFQYFVTFVDDFSRMTWLFLMSHLFRKDIKTQFNKKIRVLQSDNTKEYVSHSFSS
jgi:hypothetical protein